jgi:hypothetical protein
MSKSPTLAYCLSRITKNEDRLRTLAMAVSDLGARLRKVERRRK